MKLKKWLLFAMVVVILIVAFIFMRLRYTPPIQVISADSTKTHQIDLEWTDEEPNQVYTIYWSNKPGINPTNPKTYLYTKTVINVQPNKETHAFEQAYGLDAAKPPSTNKTTLHAEFEWCYILLTKPDNKARELEVRVMKDTDFSCKNLDIRFIGKKVFDSDEDAFVSFEIDILHDADTYRFYCYSSDNEHQNYTKDFWVKGSIREVIKLPLLSNSLISVSYLKNNVESKKEIILHNEKFNLNDLKWQTVAKLCS